MFDDFGEREHVFLLLEEEWSSPDLPVDFSLEHFVWSPKTLFRTRVAALLDEIMALEAKNTRPPRRLILSHQSETLAELDFILESCRKPTILRANLDRLKLLLMDAWVISLELKAGSLKLMAAKGERFTGNRRGESAFTELLGELLSRLGKNTPFREIWEELRRYERGAVIDEVDGDSEDGSIFIVGKDKPTAAKSVRNKVTDLKKRMNS